MTEENHEKTPVRLAGTGIWTWDLPNVSLVRYHAATLLGSLLLLLLYEFYYFMLMIFHNNANN